MSPYRGSPAWLLAWLPDNRIGATIARLCCRLGMHSAWCISDHTCRRDRSRPVRTPIYGAARAARIVQGPDYIVGNPEAVTALFTDHVIAELDQRGYLVRRPPETLHDRVRRMGPLPAFVGGAAAALLGVLAFALLVWQVWT